MKTKIIKLDDIPEELEQELAAAYSISDIRDAACYDESCVIHNVEIAVANGESKLPGALLSRFPQLKLISIFGVGFDGVDLDYVTRHGIKVTNTPGVLSEDVADLAITFALAMSREVITANAFVRDGKWQTLRYPLTRKFSASKVGIVGMGRVGLAICQRLNGFGCEVFYYGTQELTIPATRLADFKAVAKAVDFLMVSASASPANNGLINLDILNLLGAQGYLINVSRGSLVNEPDLITALDEKRIAGAALDVLNKGKRSGRDQKQKSAFISEISPMFPESMTSIILRMTGKKRVHIASIKKRSFRRETEIISAISAALIPTVFSQTTDFPALRQAMT